MTSVNAPSMGVLARDRGGFGSLRPGHAAALLGAALAGFGTFLAVGHLVLLALRAAGLADVGAHS